MVIDEIYHVEVRYEYECVTLIKLCASEGY